MRPFPPVTTIPMSDDNLRIHRLSTDHLEQYDDLLRYAFQVTEKDLTDSGWENDDIRQSKFPVLEHASVLGYFDRDILVSQFAVYPMEMNIHQVIYPVGFVTSVATYPEYSGRGLMSRLMKLSLTEMKSKGQSLALLYPYSFPLYRHRGWEIVADKMTYAISNAQLPKNINVPGYVRRVTDDSKDLFELHARFAKQTHGCLFRNPLAWDEYWRWDDTDITVAIYYNQKDQPQGYMVYFIADDIMYIKEMIFLNQEARKGLVKYIDAHDSMIDEVRGSNYFSEPIAFTLDDSDIKETIRPYIMGRIIDVEAFLKHYRFTPHVNGASFTLHITDPFLEWNNKTFTITIENNRARLTNEAKHPPLTMSIGTLTTMLLGYKRATDLAKLERIQGGEEDISLLEKAIIPKRPYISDYI